MRTKKAGDLMIPLDMYPHIPYWFTVRETIAIIHHAELEINDKRSLPRAVLVFDEEYKLLGMVRRRDILAAMDPQELLKSQMKHPKKLFNMEIDPNLLEVSYENFLKVVQDKSEITVGDIMIQIKNTVDYDDHLMKIIHEICEYEHAMVAVMKDDVVVGVVRTVEVLNEIARTLGIE